MNLGVSKVDITPVVPIYLAGFAHRKEEAVEVKERLYVKIFLLEQEEEKMMFFIADLIWWDESFVNELKREIATTYQMEESSICFHATHNHSGPQTSSRFSSELGVKNESYLKMLKVKILQGTKLAHQETEKVQVELNKGVSKIGVYRRLKVDNRIEMAPNFNIPIDDQLTTISFVTGDNRRKAIWIHSSCHPTTTDSNVISSEYVGICCKEIEKQYKNCTVAFLQGFSGDVRPSLVKDNLFYRGTLVDMEKVGHQLTEETIKVLSSKALQTGESVFRRKSITIPIEFSSENIAEFVPKTLSAEWPELVRENVENGFNLTLQYLKINEQLSFLACNAELVQAYGQFINQYDKHILPLGYSNGMVCYVPTTKQLKEGGYESLESIFYFGLPSQLSTSMEQNLKIAFLNLIGGDD